MKIAENTVDTFAMGGRETAVAKIQASAKAFEILSSSLYSNSILAIIRELCANAKDSHTAAGKPSEPFHVQCPNDLGPQFKVRDFGVGMTHEFVMTRLNTYFDSTKNDSNTEIGGFGLGIKSVFSYTTSFTIACFDGTTRRVYTYQIGSSGLPEISFLTENPSSEPVGVEVCVPVMKKDYADFRRNAVEALTFYNPRPVVTGLKDEDFDIKKLYSGSNWTIYSNPGSLTAESYIEMGDVIYPIPDIDFEDQMQAWRNHPGYSMISSQIPTRAWPGRQHRGRDTVVVVYKAGIGQIDITPNREQIKLTDQSKAQIKSFEETLRSELVGQVQKKIDAETCSFWELVKKESITQLFDSDILSKFGVKTRSFTYKGKCIAEGISYSQKTTQNKSLFDTFELFSIQANWHGLSAHHHHTSHYGIEIKDGTERIVIGRNNTHKKITYNQFNSYFDKNKRIYWVEVSAKNEQGLIDDLNKVIPDCNELIVKYDDIKDQLANVKEPNLYACLKLSNEDDYYYYDLHRISKEFDLVDFSDEAKVTYSIATADSITGHLKSRITNMLYYTSGYIETFKNHGATKIYIITAKQLDQLKTANIQVESFDDILDGILMDAAVMYANERPTMTLKEFMKPLTDKNPRICLSTHYKAAKRWAKEAGNLDFYNLLLRVNDEGSSSYRRNETDQLFRSITGKGIKDYIAKKGIVSTNVTDNQVIKDIAAKAPLCARLVSDYNDPEVVDYVRTAMGWPGQTPKVTKPMTRI